MAIQITLRGMGETWHLGDELWARAVLTDEDGDTLTPTSQTVTLRDPSDAVQVTVAAPTLIVTGTYDAQFTIPAGGTRGLWTVRWVVVVGATQETEIYRFVVSSMT